LLLENNPYRRDTVVRIWQLNGLLTFMLCLFGLGGGSSHRLVWWVIPLTAVGLGFGVLLVHHHGLNDPLKPFLPGQLSFGSSRLFCHPDSPLPVWDCPSLFQSSL
jgi:hypothetical protein